MSKIAWLGAAVAVGLSASGAALAAEDASPAGDKAALMERAYGSTIVSTYSDGRQGELWIARDGSYAALGRKLNPSSGTWRVKGDKLCMKQKVPFPAPFSFCTPLPPEGFSGSWSAKAPSGDPVRIKLVRGMHGRDASPRKANAGEANNQG